MHDLKSFHIFTHLETITTVETTNIPIALKSFLMLLWNTPSRPSLSLSSSQPQSTTICLLSLQISLLFLEFYINGNIQYAFFFSSFSQHNYFETHRCCVYLWFIPSYFWTVFCWINMLQSVYPFTCQWTFKLLLPFGYWEKCCYEHVYTNNTLWPCFQFFLVYAQRRNCWIIWIFNF